MRDPDAVRRPAARPFVQDAQSEVRLPVSPSRRSGTGNEQVYPSAAAGVRDDSHVTPQVTIVQSAIVTCSTYNGHHKVVVNLQASNTENLKN